ncbi:hypothetical protein SAMN03159496_04619 [Rhizobium sp. NFR07]|uniref:hypothetical protein n=1 Tax=Rhizobium sp. NFR07 TaxID=1566262 RepID=UPI0008E9DC49|nr:hypothetical protein [Rhizobium sp. NFR07]SFB52211.1 hypothetical protein SAMN03159496_04619 [Rhizobium sp. NFR07]
MNLLPNAGAIARRAWSLRLIEIAAAADIILNVVPFVSDWLPWWLTIALLVCAWGARLIAQPEKEKANANQQDPTVEAG